MDISVVGNVCTNTAKKAGAATLTISALASKNYKAASKTVKVTVTVKIAATDKYNAKTISFKVKVAK